MEIDFEHGAAHGYTLLLSNLLTHGASRSPRGMATRNLRNVLITIPDPTDVLLTGIGRKLSTPLAALESLQLVGGFSDPKLTVKVAPQYARFLDGDTFWGAYGVRTAGSLPLALERLQQDPDTRQAVVPIWQPRDLVVTGKHDYPCTLSYTFEREYNQLHLTTHMRSNDAWLGFPYDIVQHTAVQRSVAAYLGLQVGVYSHFVNAMHLYERDIDKVVHLLTNFGLDAERSAITGGILQAYDGPHDWRGVQETAQEICYHPTRFLENTTARTDEEYWLATTMQKWYAENDPE